MSEKFIIVIELGNDAFKGNEVEAIKNRLTWVGEMLDLHLKCGPIYDVNGNRCGSYEFKKEE